MTTDMKPLDTLPVIHGKKGRFNVSKKVRIIIASIAALLVISGAVVAFTFYNRFQEDTTNDTSSSNSTGATGAVPNYTAVLSQAANNPEEAQATLDKALDKPTSSEEKAQIYAMKSSIAASDTGGTKYDQAIAYSLQADQQNQTPQSAANLAYYYNKTGNKAEVLKWYEVAVKRFGDPAQLKGQDQGEYEYYIERVKELKNGA